LAAYTRPHFEAKAQQFLDQRNFETFVPTHRSWRRWSDRKKLVDLPLFPSYVFLRLELAQRQRAMQAPGFLWFVHNCSGPVVVDECELEAVRSILASGIACDPMPMVSIGDEVEIVAGPLRGYRGFLHRKDRGAIILTIAAIGGAIRVSLPDPSVIRRTRDLRDSTPALVKGPLPMLGARKFSAAGAFGPVFMGAASGGIGHA
jgi:transcription antitermination factor NusG